MTEPAPMFQVGQRASLSKTVTEEVIDSYAEIVGDFNPLHVDEAYARKSRFGGRIAHGMFTGGLISAVLGNKLLEGDALGGLLDEVGAGEEPTVDLVAPGGE